MGNDALSDPPPWYYTNKIMADAGFSWHLRRASQIWAAKDHECPKCGAPAYTPCKNLNGVKTLGIDLAKENAHPHVERIDYKRLELELRRKGY